MTTQTLTTQQLAAMPRVNLLPPEIALRRRARAIQVGMGAAVAASVAIVGVVYLMAHQSANDAQTDLDTAKAQSTTLQSQLAQYAGDEQLRADLSAQQLMLEDAMGKEIQWSHFLNDLSLRIPNNVWVTHLTMSANVDTATVAPATADTVLTDAGVGKVGVEGVALSHDDVAAWLNSLAHQKGYANPFFSKSEEGFIGTTPVATWSSTNTLTEDAWSGRYTKPAGS